MPEMDYSKSSPFSQREGAFINFDTRFSIYNLKAKHLRRSKTRLAKVRTGSGFFRLATLGDSTVSGSGTTNAGTECWPAVLKNILAENGYPSAGTGLASANRNSSPDTRYTIGAGWNVYQVHASSLRQNNTTANPIAFTSDTAGTIVRVYYTSSSTAFTVAIDGGAAVTVTPPGSGSNTLAYEVTGLANTTHAVSVVRTGAGNAYIYGMEVRSSATAGVLLYNGGISGAIANRLTLSGIFGVMNTATVDWQSDLIIIRMQTNDTFFTVPSVYKTEMQTAITQAKASGADVVLMTSCPSDGKDFTDTTRILYELADENDIPLLDHLDKFGTYAEHTASGMMSDTLHPNLNGYATEALSVFSALFS